MRWVRHGVLNTAEHALTRVMDALTTLMIVRLLDTAVFAELAVAQAYVAPLLFVFLAPETILYRDYARWKESGELWSRVVSLRHFGWMKGLVAVLVSLGLAAFQGSVWVYLWAFSLALGPQLCGADREFMRMDLRLPQLNVLNLYQKGTLLAGTLLALGSGDSLMWISCAGMFSVGSSALLAVWFNRESRMPRVAGITMVGTVHHSLRSFSLWNHLAGVVNNWLLTMDLFFLGAVGGAQAYTLGLYGATLKLANLAHAAPSALGNLFSIWIGRAEGSEGEQRRALRKFSVLLAVGAAVQAGVLILLTPWILEFLSRGRWTPEDQELMAGWLAVLLVGGVLHQSSFLYSSWVWLKGVAHHFFFVTYLPLGAGALGVFWLWGDSMESMTWIKMGVFGVQLSVFWGYSLWQRGRVA